MKDTSGPAFPQHVCELCTDPVGHMEPKYSGMTARAVIAMHVLGGIVSRANGPAPDWDKCASDSVLAADALLKELEK